MYKVNRAIAARGLRHRSDQWRYARRDAEGASSAITFCSVVSFAEHLTVLNVSTPAFAPSSHMISLHLGSGPNLLLVRIVSNRTMWAV